MFYITYMLAELQRRSLSAAGRRTVVVVTHDHDIARRAGRIVRMRGGRLLPAE